jgi:uncharacterized protein (DUF433 family)
MIEARIIDRGRGPEIAGSRITVFDILSCLQAGWHPTQIALFFRLGTRQVDAAVRYIDKHKEEVLAEYQKIIDRINRGNPPELQAKLDAVRGTARAMVEQIQRSKRPEAAERLSGGR